MKRLIQFLLVPIFLFIAVGDSLAQKRREATASYTIVLSRTSTMQETETLCIEQARLKAIADAFGYSISETTVSNVSDQSGKVSDAFNVLTKTSVRGEWITDTSAPKLAWTCSENELAVTATVAGTIRENNKEGKTTIEFYSCSPADVTTEKSAFRSGQPLNAFFRTARSGYLSVFYLDRNSGVAYRVFPAPSYTSLDHFEVRADEAYVLFNRAYASQFPGYPSSVDLTMDVPQDKIQVIDEVIAVYSPTPYKKPLLSSQTNQQTLPELTSNQLQNWLVELKSNNKEAIIHTVNLIVSK